MKLHVIVAHPDDEVIICGATIAKLISRGDNVHVSYCTKNEEAYFGAESSKVRAKRTVEEANNSSQSLGFSYHFLGFKDMHTGLDKGLLIKAIIKEIRYFEPDVIITHYNNDKHIDHRTVGSLVAEANFQSGCQLCGGNKVWSAKLVLQGEVDLEMTTPFNFQFVSTVSEKDVDCKLNAFKAYESVKTEHNTSNDWLFKKLKTVSGLRGKAVDQEFGEAFIAENYSPLGYKSTMLLAELLRP